MDMHHSKSEAIGNRIRRLRHEKSQADFAEMIEISLRALKYYESGERMPPSSVLSKIAKIGGVSVDWILTGEIERVGERPAMYGPDETFKKIFYILDELNEKNLKKVLEYVEERKRLQDFEEEAKRKK